MKRKKILKELDELIKNWQVIGYEADMVDDMESYIKDLLQPISKQQQTTKD